MNHDDHIPGIDDMSPDELIEGVANEIRNAFANCQPKLYLLTHDNLTEQSRIRITSDIERILHNIDGLLDEVTEYFEKRVQK